MPLFLFIKAAVNYRGVEWPQGVGAKRKKKVKKRTEPCASALLSLSADDAPAIITPLQGSRTKAGGWGEPHTSSGNYNCRGQFEQKIIWWIHENVMERTIGGHSVAARLTRPFCAHLQLTSAAISFNYLFMPQLSANQNKWKRYNCSLNGHLRCKKKILKEQKNVSTWALPGLISLSLSLSFQVQDQAQHGSGADTEVLFTRFNPPPRSTQIGSGHLFCISVLLNHETSDSPTTTTTIFLLL